MSAAPGGPGAPPPGPPGPGHPPPAPAGVGELLHPVERILGLPVLLEPVVEREGARERGDFLADQLLLLGQREVHLLLPLAGLARAAPRAPPPAPPPPPPAPPPPPPASRSSTAFPFSPAWRASVWAASSWRWTACVAARASTSCFSSCWVPVPHQRKPTSRPIRSATMAAIVPGLFTLGPPFALVAHHDARPRRRGQGAPCPPARGC